MDEKRQTLDSCKETRTKPQAFAVKDCAKEMIVESDTEMMNGS